MHNLLGKKASCVCVCARLLRRCNWKCLRSLWISPNCRGMKVLKLSLSLALSFSVGLSIRTICSTHNVSLEFTHFLFDFALYTWCPISLYMDWWNIAQPFSLTKLLHGCHLVWFDRVFERVNERTKCETHGWYSLLHHLNTHTAAAAAAYSVASKSLTEIPLSI